MEAAELKPSDLNGLADPYVKGHLGSYRFRSKTQMKTLSPKWLEEFNIPITSWESPNLLVLELRDKDHIFDDMLGDCAININDLRGGQRHDKWLPLRNIKMGRLHLAITVLEGEDDKTKEQKTENTSEHLNADDEDKPKPAETSTAQNRDMEKASNEEKHHMVDQFEAINIEGQEKTGIWVHHPGRDVSQTWEPRKGRARKPETRLHSESNDGSDSPKSTESDNKSNDDNKKKVNRLSTIKKGMNKIGSMFSSNSKDNSPRGDAAEFVIPTPRANIRSVNDKEKNVRVIFDQSCDLNISDEKMNKDDGENSKRVKVKDYATNMIKKPANSLKSVLSRKGTFRSSEDNVSVIDEDESLAGEGTPKDSNSPIVHKKESIVDDVEKSESAEKNCKLENLESS